MKFGGEPTSRRCAVRCARPRRSPPPPGPPARPDQLHNFHLLYLFTDVPAFFAAAAPPGPWQAGKAGVAWSLHQVARPPVWRAVVRPARSFFSWRKVRRPAASPGPVSAEPFGPAYGPPKSLLRIRGERPRGSLHHSLSNG